MRARAARRLRGGFTLVELLIAVAVAGLLAAVAVPSWQSAVAQARRSDATAAITRVRLAQESFRALHGRYATQLPQLPAAPLSPEGWYEVALYDVAPDRYTVTATPRAGGPQTADRACPRIGVIVRSGFAEPAEPRACWSGG